MQVHDQRMAIAEQRAAIRRAAEALLRLTAQGDWKVVMEYIEHRMNIHMQNLLGPVSGDGMTVALSTERTKGALQELKLFPQYIQSIIQTDAQYRKTDATTDVEVAPKSPPPASEGDLAQTETR